MRNANAESENVLRLVDEWAHCLLTREEHEVVGLSRDVCEGDGQAGRPRGRQSGRPRRAALSVAAFTARPIRTMTKTATATTAASRIVHPNAASVGVWYFGNVWGAMA